MVGTFEPRGLPRSTDDIPDDWAFGELGWAEIIHVIGPDNAASIAVARKLGSRYRGPGQLPAPHEQTPVDIYGQTREQWQLRASSESA